LRYPEIDGQTVNRGSKMDLHCKKCLTGRTGDVLGAPCRTSSCDGIIEEIPAFKTLVDELPEPMTCGRRGESTFGRQDGPFPGPDHWQKFKSNGNRICSYCGSLHPEDMFALVHASATADEGADYRSVVEIEPSDKNYKVYISQPGVRNAHDGGIKFYMQHLPRKADGSLDITEEQNAEYSKAIHASKVRFSRHLAHLASITARFEVTA
jgi:hypothetical protein